MGKKELRTIYGERSRAGIKYGVESVMRHKNAEMIKAKVDNMELVVFYKLPNEEWWQSESESTILPDEDDIEYFLCLPKHKNAVLNALNGGESQVASISSGWLSANCGDPVEWGGE